jgi:hypothetical protein
LRLRPMLAILPMTKTKSDNPASVSRISAITLLHPVYGEEQGVTSCARRFSCFPRNLSLSRPNCSEGCLRFPAA